MLTITNAVSSSGAGDGFAITYLSTYYNLPPLLLSTFHAIITYIPYYTHYYTSTTLLSLHNHHLTIPIKLPFTTFMFVPQTSHRRTLLYLEQMILKYKAHAKSANIKQMTGYNCVCMGVFGVSVRVCLGTRLYVLVCIGVCV